MRERIIALVLAIGIVAVVPATAVAQGLSSAVAIEELAVTEAPDAGLVELVDEAQATPEGDRESLIEEIKAGALEAIAVRLETVGELRRWIADAADVLTAEHAAVLAADLDYTEVGLAGVAAAIEEATDVATLAVLVPAIFEDYRVYLVLVPKVYVLIVADFDAALAAGLWEGSDKLEDVIEYVASLGFDMSTAWAHLAETRGHATLASELAHQAGQTVLGLTAADWPASHEVFDAAGILIDEAGVQLRQGHRRARATIRAIYGAVWGR